MNLRLGTGESQEWFQACATSRAWGPQVCVPGLSRGNEVFAAPRENVTRVFHSDDIRNQPRMPAVSIGKCVNDDQLIMKSDSTFVDLVCLLIQPILCISQELAQFFEDLMDRHAEVFLCFSGGAGPFPCLVEHAPVEFTNIPFADRVQTR